MTNFIKNEFFFTKDDTKRLKTITYKIGEKCLLSNKVTIHNVQNYKSKHYAMTNLNKTKK